MQNCNLMRLLHYATIRKLSKIKLKSHIYIEKHPMSQMFLSLKEFTPYNSENNHHYSKKLYSVMKQHRHIKPPDLPGFLFPVSSQFHISPVFLLIYCNVSKPVCNTVTVKHVLALRLLKPTVSTPITVQMHQVRHATSKERF